MRSFVVVVVAIAIAVAACTPKEPVEIDAGCSLAEKTEACAVGKSAVCIGGTWREEAICPDGCVRKSFGHGSTAPICENAVARADMICTTEFSRICSVDGHMQLQCRGAHWKAEKPCPTSCSFPKTGIVCN